MWGTLTFGAIASSALIIGAAIGVRSSSPNGCSHPALVRGRGADHRAELRLFEDSYERGGIWLAAIGLFAV